MSDQFPGNPYTSGVGTEARATGDHIQGLVFEARTANLLALAQAKQDWAPDEAAELIREAESRMGRPQQ